MDTENLVLIKLAKVNGNGIRGLRISIPSGRGLKAGDKIELWGMPNSKDLILRPATETSEVETSLERPC